MLSLENAVVFDLETYPNVFTLDAEFLNSETRSVWEISHFRDDRQQLFTWLNYLDQCNIPMIGFNSVGFDYPVIHWLRKNPQATVEQIYAFAMNIITSNDRFGNTIWESDRFAPQIDLFKVHHFDNPAKSTSLKALQVNMRSEQVEDLPIPVGTVLTEQQTRQLLIPYGTHDVQETKKFAHHSMDALKFRVGLLGQIPGDVMNFNDTKIGAKLLEKRLGDDVCYTRANGRKQPRQTVRNRIALADIIFPYIRFDNPEFARVLDYMKAQVLTPDDIESEDSTIKTKGVFAGLKAHVGGMDFHFGTGGIHGSIAAQLVRSTNQLVIRDIDVASLYPSIAVVNKLAPAHLGERFSVEYESLLIDRRKHKKGTVENASLKLAANGTYGNSNNKFSVFYDPQFTMTITINGQLMLCMLAEWLTAVPTLQFVQINTDGITYRIDREYVEQAKEIEKRWEAYTLLVLEDAEYSRMWIRDVNNYVAETPEGKLKQKGAYWHPDPQNYISSIANAGPPAWHKDFNPTVVTMAAVAAMTTGIDPELYIRCATDPFDFMLRAKVKKSDRLMIGDRQVQGITRYYVARDGEPMRKVSPPVKGAQVGEYKRASKVPDALYRQVVAEVGVGVWDERIHTKNKSTHQMRETGIQQGWRVAECNRARDFDFSRVDYAFYVQEAKKLIIAY